MLPAVRTRRAVRNPSKEEHTGMGTEGIPAASGRQFSGEQGMRCRRKRIMERENDT